MFRDRDRRRHCIINRPFDEISSTSFSNNFISLSFNSNVALSIGRLNKVSNNMNYEKKVLQNGFKYPRFNFNIALSIGRLNKVRFDKISVKSIAGCHGRFDTINTISFDKIRYTSYSIVFISPSFNSKSNVRCHGHFDMISFDKISSTSYSIYLSMCSCSCSEAEAATNCYSA